MGAPNGGAPSPSPSPSQQEEPAATSPGGAPSTSYENVRRDVRVVLPARLTARQRAALHEGASAAGLAHESTGEGEERRLALGPAGAPEADLALPESSGSPPDTLLASCLADALGMDFGPFLARTAASAAAAGAVRVRAVVSKRPARQGPCVDAAEFAARMAPLVEMEKDAEVEQAQEMAGQVSLAFAQSKGFVLANLKCVGVEGGLLGRSLIKMVGNKNNGQDPLPASKMSPSDVVEIRQHKGDGAPIVEGVVFRMDDSSITVAVDDLPDDAALDVPLRVVRLANEVTYKRLRETLDVLSRGADIDPERFPGAALADVLFGRRDPAFDDKEFEWDAVNAGLDDSQKAAVSLALQAKDVALIHGPPGTGKTTAVVEAILQEVGRGSRVLAASASNVAVDNLVERLKGAQGSLKVVRVGHPARLLPQVLDSSLEALVLRSDNSALARDCRDEIRGLLRQMGKLERWKKAERREISGELRKLRKEERQRQEKAVEEVLGQAQVVACTLTGLQARSMRGQKFDVCFIDEAAQALEVACWGGLLRARKCVLAGDHLQLPPTVVSPQAEKAGLGVTLFERVHGMYGETVSEMLTTQYRMNADIMDWSSAQLYGGRLGAHPSVASHDLGSLGVRLPEGAGDDPELPVLMLVDTAGCEMDEAADEAGSKFNPGEARVVMALVRRLVRAGLQAGDIGVITPYSAQVGVLRELRGESLPGLEISTVDGFQGREKEAVVISTVRCNSEGGVGFLSDRRRMNVAVTRARRHCCLVGDSETVGKDGFLKTLISHFEDRAEYHSAEEFAGAGDDE